MATSGAGPPSQRNLRRPDIMSTVQARVLSHYRSDLVDHIRANGHVIGARGLTVKLAKVFGFCYGVERAIDLAYAAREAFPPEQPIYLLGEIIHNPEVNERIRSLGIKTLSSKPSEEEIALLREEDVVIIPAFGTEVATRRRLEEKGCIFVDTTCGDVMSVWKRVRQYSRDSVTSIVHGKVQHEETRATTSQTAAFGAGHYLVVLNLDEAEEVCRYILNGGSKEQFLARFKDACSSGFDPELHLRAIGVANQTTMLRSETEEVQRRFYQAMLQKYGRDRLQEHFRFFDTICGATQERQDSLKQLLRSPLDLLLVIGAYNSSNTSHLAEIGQAAVPTYFIRNASGLISEIAIQHYDQFLKREIETRQWLPSGVVTLGITAGASCPNSLIESAIRRLFQLRGVSMQELLTL